jgi:hypothetical protein
MISLSDQIVHLFRLGHSGTFWAPDWNPGESDEWRFFRQIARPHLPAWPDLLLEIWPKLKHVPEILHTLMAPISPEERVAEQRADE